MKRVNAGKYELEVDGVHYEVLKRDVPIVEWFVFRDKVALGTFSTYRDARKAVHEDIESVPSSESTNDEESDSTVEKDSLGVAYGQKSSDDDEEAVEEDSDEATSEEYSHKNIFSDAV